MFNKLSRCSVVLVLFAALLSSCLETGDKSPSKTINAINIPETIGLTDAARTMMKDNNANVQYNRDGDVLTEGLVMITIYVPEINLTQLVDLSTVPPTLAVDNPKKIVSYGEAFSAAEIRGGKATKPILWMDVNGKEFGTYFDGGDTGYCLFFIVATPCFRYTLEAGMTELKFNMGGHIIEVNAADGAGGDIKWLYRVKDGPGGDAAPIEMFANDTDDFWNALFGLRG